MQPQTVSAAPSVHTTCSKTATLREGRIPGSSRASDQSVRQTSFNDDKGPFREAIQSVLDRCADFTRMINASSMTTAQAAAFIVIEMGAIDTRLCPDEFRLAFRDHIEAWKVGPSIFTQTLSPSTTTSVNFNAEVVRREKEAALATDRINETYLWLVQLALGYEVIVPESVVVE